MSAKTTPFNLENLKKVLDHMSPKKYSTKETDEIPKFMVIFGKNGVGKSRFLKAIQQHIVNQENVIFPNMIVRKLNYGEEPDRYDPNSTEHPLVSKEMIESFFKCNFNNWEGLKEVREVNEELNSVFKTYKKNIVTDPNFMNKPQECYFFEFRKYFRRQILKKVCFGSLEQLLMLNLPYDSDIEEINQSISKFENDYKVNFNYKIVKNTYSIVEKLNLNELIEFEDRNFKFRIKFNQLSPGEKLILHFLLIYKDKDLIKIDKSKINTNQVLLLDEPDSHCEPDLVVNLVKLINDLLVTELEIQVIMTSHNTTTMFSLQFDDKIYLLENDGNGNVEFLKKNRDSTRDILAKNINYAIDFMNLSYDQHYSLTRDFFHSLGNCFEDLIKKMTRNDQEKFNFLEQKELFKKLLDICNDKDVKHININENHHNLEDVEIENQFNDNIMTYWPKNRRNIAWDFMIFYKKQLYLYQVSTRNKTEKEQYFLSKKVMEKLIDKNKNRLEYWIKAKFFFIISTINNKDTDIKTQCPSLDEVFSITEIFKNLFKGDKLIKPMSPEKLDDLNNNKLKFDNLNILSFNNLKFKFKETIKIFLEIDKDKNLYAIIFDNDRVINIVKYKEQNFYMIYLLIGHTKQIDYIFKNSDSLESFAHGENFKWNIDINNIKPEDYHFKLNKTNDK